MYMCRKTKGEKKVQNLMKSLEILSRGEKRHQKFWRMKRNFFGKVTRKSITCQIFLDRIKKLLKGGNMLHRLGGGGGRPCKRVAYDMKVNVKKTKVMKVSRKG